MRISRRAQGVLDREVYEPEQPSTWSLLCPNVVQRLLRLRRRSLGRIQNPKGRQNGFVGVPGGAGVVPLLPDLRVCLAHRTTECRGTTQLVAR